MMSFIKIPKSLLSNHRLVAVLLLLLGLVAGYFVNQYKWFSDFTQNQRNSLSSESKKILQAMPDVIEIQAMASDSAIKGKYFRKSIMAFIAPYQRHKKNIAITFLAPEKDMTQARRIGLNEEGDWRITYQKQSAYFKLPYTEEGFTNLLLNLRSGKEQVFFFTGGHQEPQLGHSADNGLGRLAEALASNGISAIQSSHLEKMSEKHVLVINAPKQPFNQKEIQLIQEHVKSGGNLIWLVDSHNLQGLEGLASGLNIEISQGIVVDISNQEFGMDPRVVAASAYARHEIFSDFSINTRFPNARRVSPKENRRTSWKDTQLIGVAENGWLSKDIPKKLSREGLAKNIAKLGPINIAMALERTEKNKQQHILVIGSSEFLLNRTIEKSGNLELALRLFKWSSANHVPVNLRENYTKDTVVVIPNEPLNYYLILAIFNGFQFVLPAMLFLTALFVWFRRSRM